MKKLKITILSVILLIITAFATQESAIDGLQVTFTNVSEDYVRPAIKIGRNGSYPVEASEGMKFVKLKLTLKNEGQKDCAFDFADVFISTEQDSLYRFHKLQNYLNKTKTIIKPQKEIKRVVLFEFPDKAKPKELFIEDKRYMIVIEK